MNILVVSPLPPPTSGIGMWTQNILEYYNNNNSTRFRLFVQDTASKYRNVLKHDFWNRVVLGSLESVIVILDIRKNLRKMKPDIVHLSTSSSFALFKDAITINLAKRWKTEVVLHWHFGRIPALSGIKNWEWKLLYRLAKGVSMNIVIDNCSYKSLVESGLCNVTYIPNPISIHLERFAIANADLQIHRKKGMILFVAHVIRKKGIFELVEACTQIAAVESLIVIGPCENSVQQSLTGIAAKRDGARWIHFAGILGSDEVFSYMLKSEVLALPSYTEGFPNVVIEAMAAGCAVIASDVGAIPDILAIDGDKPCGQCVPVRDKGLLERSIKEMLSVKGKARWYGANGRQRVLERYTSENISVMYETVWRTAGKFI